MKKKFQIVISLGASAILLSPMLVLADAALIQCGRGDTPCTLADALKTAYGITKFLMRDLAVPLAALGFMAAGIIMLTAGGDTGKRDQAKAIFKNTAIGFAIILAAYLIVNFLFTSLVGDQYKIL